MREELKLLLLGCLEAISRSALQTDPERGYDWTLRGVLSYSENAKSRIFSSSLSEYNGVS